MPGVCPGLLSPSGAAGSRPAVVSTSFLVNGSAGKAPSSSTDISTSSSPGGSVSSHLPLSRALDPLEELYVHTQLLDIGKSVEASKLRPRSSKGSISPAADFAASYAGIRNAYPLTPFAPFFASGSSVPLLALYDTGALRAFSPDGLNVITLSAATRLGLQVLPIQLTLSGVGSTSIVGVVNILPFECFTQTTHQTPQCHKHSLIKVFVVDSLQPPFIDLIISPESLRTHTPLRLGMSNLISGSTTFSFLAQVPSSFQPCPVHTSADPLDSAEALSASALPTSSHLQSRTHPGHKLPMPPMPTCHQRHYHPSGLLQDHRQHSTPRSALNPQWLANRKLSYLQSSRQCHPGSGRYPP